MLLNSVSSTGFVSSFNKATGNYFTSKGRQSLDKSVSEQSDDAAVIMTGESKRKQNAGLGKTKSFAGQGIPKLDSKGKPMKDENGNIIMQGVDTNISRNIFRNGAQAITQAGMSSRVAKFSNFETLQEQSKEVEAVLDEKALNGALDRLKDVLTNAQNGTLTDVGVDNLIANRSEFEDTAATFGGAEAAKQVKEIIDNLEKYKNTNDTEMKAKLIGNAKDGANKIDVNAMSKIDPQSVAQLKEAIRNGTMHQSLANKNYGAALTEVVRKAMEKASAHTQNVKNDPKTENIIPQLLRELLDETRKKK